jgi:hypothetical protein
MSCKFFQFFVIRTMEWIRIWIRNWRNAGSRSALNQCGSETLLEWLEVDIFILVCSSHCLSYLVHRTFFLLQKCVTTKNSCTCPYKHHMCVRMVCEHCCQM